MMKCQYCGEEIIGRRPNSLYCSSQCSGKAKRERIAGKETSMQNEETQFLAQAPKMSLNPNDEIRYVEREHFEKISKLHLDYGERISNLKETNQQQSFKIERLEDKIIDLKEKHVTELSAANKSATKDVVQTISTMPAAQSVLGALANGFMSKAGGGALAGVEDGFNEQEKQIIEQIRRMQADAQSYLIQMLYFLFAKRHEEQMEIFASLQAFMANSEEEEDI
ncbi:hypothetical protein L3073_06065 [Ancylomarina sp. DW003]|nr:hypothetical protein [Ancylomarina sp. DW003]MDE5421766.1 hypothetical protein [Ancylomarina sp. DW003]